MTNVASEQQDFNTKKEYMMFLFGDDYDKASGEIIQLPFMEHRCGKAIISKYLGHVPASDYPRGTSIRHTINLGKLVELFMPAIDIEASPEENMKLLIKYDLEKKLGHVWYFRFWLDKITIRTAEEKPFVDPRANFKELNEVYRKGPDHEAGLVAIDKAITEYEKGI